MSLYIVLVNIFFSAALAELSDSGPLLDGFVSSKRPAAKHHAHHRHRDNHHLDRWVISHSYSDSPDEPSELGSLMDESKETLDSFLRGSPIGGSNDSPNENKTGRVTKPDRYRRNYDDASVKKVTKRNRVDTDDSEVPQEIPYELPNKRLGKYKEQSVCKYTVENEMSSGLTHIRCKQPGKIESDPRDHRYCIQTYMYTNSGCEYNVAHGNVKLYTGCMYVIGKSSSKQKDLILKTD